MALSTKKLMQKKAAKNKKRQQKIGKNNTMVNTQSELYEVLLDNSIWDLGIGVACITMADNKGGVVMSVFKIDVFCLGIKDSFRKPTTFERYFTYRDAYGQGSSNSFEKVSAAYLKALILESVKYAKNIGFNPQGDYKKAMKILEHVKITNAIPDFKFGSDGKPYYCSGPFDSMDTSKKIIAQLEKKLGADNFHYTCAIDPDNIDEFGEANNILTNSVLDEGINFNTGQF